ncbi:squalene--hopene cyclase [Streptomyces sp. 4N509B]|uniref:squalene--hopene cyclase n=1 Tax=Streptomyces sp. 4N509B TaxID=3457413 RepID=UPI003FD2192B
MTDSTRRRSALFSETGTETSTDTDTDTEADTETDTDTDTDTDLAASAAEALDHAVRQLVARQRDDGHWDEGLGNKVSVDAHHLLLHAFLRRPLPPEAAAITAWIRARQSADGGWANFAGGPDEVSTSVTAYLALRVVGDRPDEDHMRAAAARVRELGGPARGGGSSRLWLALFGQWPWDDVPAVPPELVLLPASAPVSLDDFAVWARSTVLSLAVITARRPVCSVDFDLAELLPTGEAAPGPRATRSARALGAYGRWVPGRVRRRALRRVREWLVARQDTDGCWGGIHAPTLYAVLALHVLGEREDGERVERALAGLRTFLQDEGDGRVSVRFSHSEVWDTALALQALQSLQPLQSLRALQPTGSAATRPATDRAEDGAVDQAVDRAVDRAIAWLVPRQLRTPGEWSPHRPGLTPGGWAFEEGNGHCPDTDDTALVLRSLLHGTRDRDPEEDEARERGLRWLAGMAGRDGGWAAFDADPRVSRVRRIMSSESVAYVDPPTADVTAHVVETLALAGPAHSEPVRRGVAWLLAAQEDDGSWYGRWGCNHVYGTSAVLTALAAAGVPSDDPATRRAVAWLVNAQNEDGGWGEDHRSYVDPRWRGRGESTASQTSWALTGLLAAGGEGAHRAEHVTRGVRWLLRNQSSPGCWTEEQYTGTGFPWTSPIRYGSYPRVFPVMALAAFLAAFLTATGR